jgi:hypothetical protein
VYTKNEGVLIKNWCKMLRGNKEIRCKIEGRGKKALVHIQVPKNMPKRSSFLAKLSIYTTLLQF